MIKAVQAVRDSEKYNAGMPMIKQEKSMGQYIFFSD